MLTRVGSNFNSLTLFLVQVFHHFRWKRVMIVYTPQGHADQVRTAVARIAGTTCIDAGSVPVNACGVVRGSISSTQTQPNPTQPTAR